jgi:hypothetical protein
MAMLAFSPIRGDSFMKFLEIRPLLVVIGTMSGATAASANWPQFQEVVQRANA